MLQINPLRTAIQTIACATALVVLSGCEEGTGSSTDPSTTTPTDLVVLSALNFEGDAKFIGPRVHAIVGEVYRNLFYIHQSVDIDDRMLLASSVPRDDIITDFEEIITLDQDGVTGFGDTASGVEYCTNAAGINTKFEDNDASGDLSAGDRILRDTDNVTCEYDFVDPADVDSSIFDETTNPKPHWIPTALTGSISYTFTGGDPSLGTYTGTATFGDPDPANNLNFEIENGLLQATEDTENDSFNGTVDFVIDFRDGDATFTNINVKTTEAGGSFNGPNSVTIDEVDRDRANATDRVSIVNGSFSSDSSGQRLDFRTIAFNGNGMNELSSPDNDLPDRGAILFVGGNSTAAHARTSVSAVVGIVSIGLELSFDASQPLDPVANPATINQFDDSQQAEPGGTSWFVSNFLLGASPYVVDVSMR